MASTDVLPVVVIAEAVSLLGGDTVVLPGWAEVVRHMPRIEGGVEVVDLEIVSLEVVGASRLGFASLAERPNDGPAYVSAGEIRSLQATERFPASSFFELFVDLDLPSSLGEAVHVHNQTPLRLTPHEGGRPVSLDNWPPLGVTYARESDDSACIPLVDANNLETELGLCIGSLTLAIAPQLASYSVARGSPSRLHPADVLGMSPRVASPAAGQAPFVRVGCTELGLSADGCDEGADGDQDDIDALSFGVDSEATRGLDFSVSSGSLGAAGSAVEAQRNCPPTDPGSAPEPESDVFGSPLDGSNQHILDGNGPVGSCASAFPLALLEAATDRDDLNALHGQDSSVVDENADGVPERAVYFSLDAASPSLDSFGFSAADVLASVDGAPPAVYAPAVALGLRPGDDLDALCLRENGDGVFGAGDVLAFSLAPGSPTLTRIEAGAADLLAPGDPPTVVERAPALGLLLSDDVNALNCAVPLVTRGGSGDVDCNGATDGIDAALILQFHADLSDMSCPQSADVNGDGTIDSVDAFLVLQFEAGLLRELPV